MEIVDIPIIVADSFLDFIACYHYKIPLHIVIDLNSQKVNVEQEIQKEKYDKFIWSLYSGKSISDSLHEFNRRIGQLT